MVEAVLPKTILQFAFFLHRPAGPCLVAVVAAEEAIQIRTSYHVLRVQVEATSTRKRRCPVAAAEAEEAAECLSWQPRPNSPSRTICTEDWASENRSRCSDRHCPKPMPAAEAVEVATLFPSFGYLASPCPPSLVDGCCWSLYFLLLASNDCSTTYPENDFAQAVREEVDWVVQRWCAVACDSFGSSLVRDRSDYLSSHKEIVGSVVVVAAFA